MGTGLWPVDFKEMTILHVSVSDTRSIVVILVKIFKTQETIEVQLVRLTEVCDKV